MRIRNLAAELIALSLEISKGNIPAIQHFETFSVCAYGRLLNSLDGAEAFNLLQELCNQYQNISGEHLGAYLDLLNQVAQSAKTTELPIGMQEIISAHIELAAAKSLTDWYRI